MKLIEKFIVWCLLKYNAQLDCGNYVVRMYSKRYYNTWILKAEEESRLDGRIPFRVLAGELSALMASAGVV